METLSRLILGIQIPPMLRPKIEEAHMLWKRRLMGEPIRWQNMEDLALVLVSLGEMGPDRVGQIGSLIAPTVSKFGPVQLVGDGAVGSPNPIQPRFIEMRVGGDVQRLVALQSSLARDLEPLVGRPESKPFAPLVNLGRLAKETEAGRTALGRVLKTTPVGSFGEFRAGAVELLAYRGTADGVKLELVAGFPLKGEN